MGTPRTKNVENFTVCSLTPNGQAEQILSADQWELQFHLTCEDEAY